MKTSVSLLSAFLLTSLLTGCLGCKTSEDDPEPLPTNGIVGYWVLTKAESMMPPSTPPDEAIAFDAAGNVTEYANGQVKRAGTYQLSTGSVGCVSNADVVTMTWPTPITLTKGSYTIAQNVLVIDQGLCLDAPRRTYKFTTASGTK